MANLVLVGRVAKELETTAVKAEGKDKNVGKFSIAVDSKNKDAEGKPITTFYNIETWNENQQNALRENLKPGLSVLVRGQLETENYEVNGSKGTSLKVANPDVEFIGKSNAALETIFVSGRLTKDVELRQTANGNTVANLSLAENYGKDKVTGKDKVNYYEVEVWNDKAESAAKYLEKGSVIKVDGTLKVEKYARTDGGKGTSLKIVNSNFNFFGKTAGKNDGAESAPAKAPTKSPRKTADKGGK